MRALPPALTAHLATGKPVLTEVLVRIRARNRTTGATETLAVWTGPEPRAVTVEGEALTWTGLGALIEVDPLVQRQRLEVRQHRLRLTPTTRA